MQLALRLAMACFVIAAPTLLYLGLLRGLEKLRDDALLMRIAESDDAPRDASAFAQRTLEQRPVRADGRGSASDRGGTSERATASDRATPTAGSGRAGGTRTDESPRPPRPESVTCGTCGASNMLGARYCGECLDELR